MTSNEILKKTFSAAIAKLAERTATDGNNKKALAISGDIAELGATIATSWGNDGRCDDAEQVAIIARFNNIVDKYVPNVDNKAVDLAWNGVRIWPFTLFDGLKTYLEKWFGIVLSCLTVCTLVGCRAFYENAGSRTVVGSVTAPIDISEPTSSINVRALYSMDGAEVYTAKDSLVKIVYKNTYTNDYFYIVKTQGQQDLEVEIEPLYTGGETNAVINAEGIQD